MTVGDLLVIPVRRLQRLRGVGNKTRREIASAFRILRERLGTPPRGEVVKETIEVRDYISSLELDVKRFARAVRGHWGIEIPQSDDPRSDNLCVAGRAGYHRRGGPARAGLVA